MVSAERSRLALTPRSAMRTFSRFIAARPPMVRRRTGAWRATIVRQRADDLRRSSTISPSRSEIDPPGAGGHVVLVGDQHDRATLAVELR